MSERAPSSVRFHLTVDAQGDTVTKRAVSAAGARRVQTEGAALGRLQGLPGVVRLVEAGHDHVTVARLEGPSLQEWARGAAPEARRALAVQLVQTLTEVHARGVVHRDLAADNVIVVQGRPVLIDFELARLEGHAHHGGTPATAAPELRWLPDARLHDRRADAHALGVLLRWLLLDGPEGVGPEENVRRLRSSWVKPEGEGLAAWVHGLMAPRRSDRLADLDGLAAVLGGEDRPLPEPPGAEWPQEALSALDRFEDEVDAAVVDAVRKQLRALVPLDPPDPVPESLWLTWARELGRAHALRAPGRGAIWEAAALELATGVPDRLWDHPGTAADLALRLDAPHAARQVLGDPDSRVGEPVLLALHAATEARLGRAVEAATAVSDALRDSRPLMVAEAQVYWRALIGVLYTLGALRDVLQLLAALPRVERGLAVACMADALGHQLERADSERRRLSRRAGALRPFVALALGTTVQQAAAVLGELALLRVAARDVDERVLEQLSHAADRLQELSDHPVGPVLAAVAAHQRRDADALARVLASLPGAAPLDLDADPAPWARETLRGRGPGPGSTSPFGGDTSEGPSWASDDDEVPTAPPPAPTSDPEGPASAPSGPHPFVVLHRDGMDAALQVCLDALRERPRDAFLWTLVFQVWSVRTETDPVAFRQELDVLLDALLEAGMPLGSVLPWRMQARLLAGDPAAALRALAAAARGFEPPWPAWLLSARCWAAMGDAERVQEALDLTLRAGAPAPVVEQTRADYLT